MGRFALILLLVHGLAAETRAGVGPWAEFSTEGIRLIDDFDLETEIRLELIGRARHSIDVAIYQQDADEEVALPIIRALRDRAEAGVAVRFVTNRAITRFTDPQALAPGTLLDLPAHAPLRYVGFGERGRWHPLGDFIHEKLLIVDRTVVLTTGRGHSRIYRNWLDKAYLLTGPLASGAQQAFDSLWRIASSEGTVWGPRGIGAYGVRRRRVPRPAPAPEVLARIRGALEEARGWIRRALAGPLAPPAREEERLRGRVIHHDLLAQLVRAGNPRSLEERERAVADSFTRAVLARVGARETREIFLSTLAPILIPEVRDALAAKARGGARVVVLTNGHRALERLTPLAINWYLAIPSMIPLLEAGAEVYAVEPDSEDHPFDYVHAKLVIAGGSVFFGSHNLNLPSSYYSDETSFEVRGAPFLGMMRERFLQDLYRTGIPLDRATLERDMAENPVPLDLSRIFGGMLMGLF